MSADGYGKASRRRGESKWGNVALPVIEHEDRMAEEESQELWNKIFPLFDASGEDAQNEVKLAVYAYYAVNGASRRTKHARDINTGGGINVLAADVRDVIGETRIRQFLRSDVDDAYSALKESGVLEHDEVFVHKAMKKGVPRGFMHCAVDFLKGCSLFTPEEEQFHDAHFQNSVPRARNARGGMTIDEEDEVNRGRMLDVQRETSRVASVSDKF